MLSRKRETYPELPVLLWHSVGTITILLQEIIEIYSELSPPPNLKLTSSNRICLVVGLLPFVVSYRLNLPLPKAARCKRPTRQDADSDNLRLSAGFQGPRAGAGPTNAAPMPCARAAARHFIRVGSPEARLRAPYELSGVGDFAPGKNAL